MGLQPIRTPRQLHSSVIVAWKRPRRIAATAACAAQRGGAGFGGGFVGGVGERACPVPILPRRKLSGSPAA